MSRRRGWRPLLAAVAAAVLTAGCAGGASEEASERRGSAYLELGVAYLQQGEPRSALQALRKAEQRRPDDARVHNALGLTYQRLDFPARARDAFQRALDNDANDPQVHNNYGAFLANQGDLAAAREQFRKALNNPVYSTPETAYYNLGWIARRQGRPEQAEEHLRTALELRPDYAQAHLSLVRLLAARERLQAAREQAARLIERHPGLAAGHLLAGELALEAENRPAAQRHLEAAAQRGGDEGAGRRARELLRRLAGRT